MTFSKNDQRRVLLIDHDSRRQQLRATALRKAWFNPSMAVPIKVTVTMPITIPSVVKIERILLARIAPQEMARPSLSSTKKFMRRGEREGNPKPEGRRHNGGRSPNSGETYPPTSIGPDSAATAQERSL